MTTYSLLESQAYKCHKNKTPVAVGKMFLKRNKGRVRGQIPKQSREGRSAHLSILTGVRSRAHSGHSGQEWPAEPSSGQEWPAVASRLHVLHCPHHHQLSWDTTFLGEKTQNSFSLPWSYSQDHSLHNPFSARNFLYLERKWKVSGGDNDLRFVFNNLLGPCLQHYEGAGQEALAVWTQLCNDLQDLLQQLSHE